MYRKPMHLGFQVVSSHAAFVSFSRYGVPPLSTSTRVCVLRALPLISIAPKAAVDLTYFDGAR